MLASSLIFLAAASGFFAVGDQRSSINENGSQTPITKATPADPIDASLLTDLGAHSTSFTGHESMTNNEAIVINDTLADTTDSSLAIENRSGVLLSTQNGTTAENNPVHASTNNSDTMAVICKLAVNVSESWRQLLEWNYTSISRYFFINEDDANATAHLSANSTTSEGFGNETLANLLEALKKDKGFKLIESSSSEVQDPEESRPYRRALSELQTQLSRALSFLSSVDVEDAENHQETAAKLSNVRQAFNDVVREVNNCNRSRQSNCSKSLQISEMRETALEYLEILGYYFNDQAYRLLEAKLNNSIARCERLIDNFYLRNATTGGALCDCSSPEHCVAAQLAAYSAVQFCNSHDSTISDELQKNCQLLAHASNPACSRDIRICPTHDSPYEKLAENISGQIDLLVEFGRNLLAGDYALRNAANVRRTVDIAVQRFAKKFKQKISGEKFLPRNFAIGKHQLKIGDELHLAELGWPHAVGKCQKAQKRVCDVVEVGSLGGNVKIHSTFELWHEHEGLYGGRKRIYHSGPAIFQLKDWRLQFTALMTDDGISVSKPFCCHFTARKMSSQFSFFFYGMEFTFDWIDFSHDLEPILQEFFCGALLKMV